MAVSTSPDLKFADATFSSFAVKVPLTKRLWSGMSSALGWFGGLVLTVALCAFANLLGRAGSWVRRGVETRKALQAIQVQALEKGLTVNEQCRTAARKATLSILLPVLAFAMVFITAFALLPIGFAFASLLLLIPPALGYVGILLGPSADIDDYLPD